MDLTEQVQRRVRKMIRGVGAPLPWRQAETAGPVQPAEGFRETLQHLPVLNEAYRKDPEGRACNHRTRENGFQTENWQV